MTEQNQTFAPPPGPGASRPAGPNSPGASGASGASTGPHGPLQRSRSDRKVAGVAGGLAAYFGIDPIILRILIVVLTLFGGSGLLIYGAGWLLLPDEGQQRSEIQKLLDRDDQRKSPKVVLLAAIIIIALLVGLGSLFNGVGGFGGPDAWPLIVVGGIATAVWYARRQPPAPQAGPPPAGGVALPVNLDKTAPSAATTPYTTAPYVPTGPYDPPVAQAPVPRAKRQRSVLGALTLSIAAIAAGVMLPFNLAGVWHLHAAAFLAILLGIIGVGLVVGAFVGRSRGLIAWGILLTLVTAIASAVPAIDAKGTGDVSWRPMTVTAMPFDGYRWAAGNATLDLTGLPASAAVVELRVQLGAGNLVVIVPAGSRVVIDAHVGLGSIKLPGRESADGVGRRVSTTIDPVPGRGIAGTVPTTLDLRLDLGAGTMEVRHAQA